MFKDFSLLSDSLNQAVRELQSKRTDDLLAAMERAIEEIKLGNQGDGDWERARRAQHELECGIKWFRESGIRAEENSVKNAIDNLSRR